jgi:uncharacterized phosphosugar-binding protein
MIEQASKRDFGLCYLREIMGLMRKTYETELAKIQRAIELAAATILAGKKCYCRYSMVHMVPDEMGDRRTGRPHIFDASNLEDIIAGDFLLTGVAGKDILTLKERGVIVVGIQNPWVFFEGAPREKMSAAPEIDKFTDLSPGASSIEDVSEFVINTYTPYTEGILKIPGVDATFLPTSTPTFLHVYWMICAGVTEKLVHHGQIPHVITS